MSPIEVKRRPTEVTAVTALIFRCACLLVIGCFLAQPRFRKHDPTDHPSLDEQEARQKQVPRPLVWFVSFGRAAHRWMERHGFAWARVGALWCVRRNRASVLHIARFVMLFLEPYLYVAAC